MLMSKIAAIIRSVGLVLLCGTVLVAPWCFGSIHASVQQWLFPGVMLSLVCGLVTLLLDGKNRFPFPVLLVPVLLLLLLIGLQLRPHDEATLAKRSPKVVELREQLLPAPDSAEYAFTKEIFPETQSNADPAPTSIYPAATRHQLSLFVLALSAFFASSLLFKNRLCVMIFAVVAASNGAILALIGIVMRLRPHGATFFIWNNSQGTFSAFLNRNNAAGYLGMCLGLAMILLLWYFFKSDKEIEENRRWDGRYEQAYMTSTQIFFHRLSRLLSPGILTWALVVGIVIAGVLISMSRGGCLAMGVALLLGFLVVFATRRFKLSMIGFVFIGVMGLGLVFWAGMNERVQQRLETIFTGDNTARPRNWSNALETARDFQWRGTGFGTYQYANLLHDEFSATNQIFIRAENQYIEIFLDLGFLGLLLLVAGLLVSLILCWRLIWQRNDDWLTALGGGLLIAVMTQAIASLFDFGLYIVANAMLLGVLCGILSAVIVPRRDGEERSDNPFSPAEFLSRGGLILTGCLFLILLFHGRREIENIHVIDIATDRLTALGDYRTTDPDELTAAVDQLETVLQRRPDDALAAKALAEAQIGLYRQMVYRGMLISDPSRSPEEIWRLTSLKNTHASLGRLRRLGFKAPVQAIREHVAVSEFLRPAFANLVRSRQSNPMSVSTHFRIAELIPFFDKEDRQRELEHQAVSRITTVAPLSSAAWYEAGLLERNLGNIADARAFWKQSLSLSRLFLVPIVQLTRGDMRGDNAETLFRETFPNSPDIFLLLASRHFSKTASPDFHDVALEQLRISCETADDLAEGERNYFTGRYFMLTEQYEEAARELTSACLAQRTNPSWRYQLAQAYFSNRQYEKATEEINKALFYAPNNKTYANFAAKVRKAAIMN